MNLVTIAMEFVEQPLALPGSAEEQKTLIGLPLFATLYGPCVHRALASGRTGRLQWQNLPGPKETQDKVNPDTHRPVSRLCILVA